MEASEKTHQRYTTVVDHLLRFLGGRADQDIAHLTSKEIMAFRDHLAARLTTGTVPISLKILRVALGQAKRDGLIDGNEAERVTMLKVKGKDRSGRPRSPLG